VNVTTGTELDDNVTSLMFQQPAVDGRVSVTVEAENVLGSAGASIPAEDNISMQIVPSTIIRQILCMQQLFLLKNLMCASITFMVNNKPVALC